MLETHSHDEILRPPTSEGGTFPLPRIRLTRGDPPRPPLLALTSPVDRPPHQPVGTGSTAHPTSEWTPGGSSHLLDSAPACERSAATIWDPGPASLPSRR